MWTNKRINEALTPLRDSYRAGTLEITYEDTLEARVTGVLSGDTFNEQTQKRLNALFSVPSSIYTSVTPKAAIRWPTPTDTARALQNFMNRRLDPWAHTKPQPRPEVQAYATSE